MGRRDVVAAVADRSGAPAAQVDGVLTALEAVLAEAVARGEKVSLTGFLTAEAVDRPARTGRNPRTGEALEIAASRGVKLTPGARLKAAVAS